MVMHLATKQTLTEIKQCVENCIGQRVVLRTNMGKRNAKESEGVVEEVYPSIFIVTVDEGLDRQRRVSYSYSDILTETVEIMVCSTEQRIEAS